jgi:Ni/Co efflux regulator RcnB
MKKLILTALIAAVAVPSIAVPTAASAQSRDYRGDRDRDRDDRRGDVRRGDRNGPDRQVRQVRQDRRQPQGARRDVRDGDRSRNWGRNDWRGYRTGNRSLYARGNWRAPFRYNSFRAGGRIQPNFYGDRYFISDPWRYRLPGAGRNQRWVRHYNDVLLVDVRRGVVIDVIHGFYW